MPQPPILIDSVMEGHHQCGVGQIGTQNQLVLKLKDICTGWVPPKVPLLTTLRGRAISYLRPGPLGPGHSVVDHIPSRSVHL